MHNGTIIMCNDVLGIITHEDDKTYTIYNYDGNTVVLDRDADVHEIIRPSALVQLLKTKLVSNRKGTA